MLYNGSKNMRKMAIGLIHLLPLPGTPLYKEGNLELSVEKALRDTKALMEGGAHGCLIQSVDKIYPSGDDTDYARLAGITIITQEVKRLVGNADFKVGVQLMWNCITPSLAVAKVCKADFTRATAMVGTTTSPFGTMEADPLKIQSYRKYIDAFDVSMIAEISGYHFKADADNKQMLALAHSAITVGANAIEVLHEDEDINNKMVHDLKKVFPTVPVVLGGKTDLENVTRRMKEADIALVGSCFENGKWGGDIDINTVREYVGKLNSIQGLR